MDFKSVPQHAYASVGMAPKFPHPKLGGIRRDLAVLFGQQSPCQITWRHYYGHQDWAETPDPTIT
jgi:hypothetical protein